jgi:hypothetical protein
MISLAFFPPPVRLLLLSPVSPDQADDRERSEAERNTLPATAWYGVETGFKDNG